MATWTCFLPGRATPSGGVGVGERPQSLSQRGREGGRECKGGGQVKRKVGGCSTTHSPERRLYHCRWPSILTPPSGCGHLYLYLVSVENQFCEACELSQFIHSAFLVREREMQMKLSCWCV